MEAELARRSLARWCQFADPTYQTPPHILKLIAALEAVERGEIKRLLVSMPPRHGKSETVSKRFPAWFLGRNPDARVILTSYGSDLAEGASRNIRNSFAEHGRNVFGVELAHDSRAVDEWNLEGRKGGLIARGIGAGITGQGADLAIIDDPVKTYEEAFSETYRNKVWNWYGAELYTRLSPVGRVILVMTRWHQDDLAGRLDEEQKLGGDEWVKVVMPMEDEAGGLLWPGRWPPEFIAQLKRKPYIWNALYQQRPTSAEGDIFKRGWWQYYDFEPAKTTFDEVLVSVDATFKGGKKNDYVVLQVWGRKGAMYYLLDQVRAQMTFTETKAALRALCAKWPKARAKLIEDKANGPAIIDELKKEIPGLVPVEPDGSKEARARAVSPYAESGNVWLPRSAPWLSDFIEELADFPKGANDDQVDAMSQALRRFASGASASALWER